MQTVEKSGRGFGKRSKQNLEFAKEVNRLVRKASKEQGCGVRVTFMAGWTTAEPDPTVERGRIRYSRTA